MSLSSLVRDQVKFTQDKALLILFAKVNGITLTETEGSAYLLRKARDGTKYVDAVHMRNSLHYQRCATDFMIYNEDGRPVYSGSDPRWMKLGIFWESLDDRNAWGGRFGDSCHFSRSRGGLK